MIAIRRRDPAVIAARAHHVLDAAARTRADWPAGGRPAMNECFAALHAALEEYGAAAEEDREAAAGEACAAMAMLLVAVSVFLGKAVAEQMMKDAAEVAK
jgi:hypothetical protein